ncbi:LysM peptidoglycan-binding domain-containing protein [candidate division KSB1 bacterium]|nr:MAG: LysM peptidoglycan-binding domain-containing protein [candidate division KSB1 bacterium]
MRQKLYALAALIPILLFTMGCASVSATAQRSSATKAVQSSSQTDEIGRMSEREKWSLAREAYKNAQKAQERKDNETAAYYYEVALEILGSLDMASIEVPTRRVLSFQRDVLKSYDRFLASIDNLPSSAGPVAVLESSTPVEESSEELPDKSDSDRENKPPVIKPNSPPLPDIPVTMNNQVAGQINFFMNKGRKVMLSWMSRAAVMFPRLRPIIAEEGLPEDILYLAMIESGLNPRAHSYAHASGVWQFIASTGRIYGLNVDKVYDERMHVEASTRAACRYLRNLYEEFDDWYLAMAAYNCGERRIEREIKRFRSRDYWRMNKLPRQTRGYVPAYLAARAICKNPTQYGFPPMPKEIPFECERVLISGPYKLEHVAQAAGHDPSIVADLNPEFVRGVTPSNKTVTVRLPAKATDQFTTRLATLPKTEIKPTQVHRVRSGETLGKIASKYGTTTKAILADPQNKRVKANRLKVGQEIVIPVPGSPEVAAATPNVETGKKEGAKPKVSAPVAAENHEIVYKVHRGESLGQISRQLGVSVEEIIKQNRIADPNVIQPGQKLRIRIGGAGDSTAEAKPDKSEPTQDAVVEAPAPDKNLMTAANDSTPQRHKVQAGETVWSIARTYNQDPMKILSWNGLLRDSTIFPGQELIVNRE